MGQNVFLFIPLLSRLDQELSEGRNLVHYFSIFPALSLEPGTQLILSGCTDKRMSGWMDEVMSRWVDGGMGDGYMNG